MTEDDRVRQFGRLLGGAGRAHHEVFGGPNPGWPQWYAEHLHPDIAEHVGHQPTVEEIADWLQRADEQHRAEAADRPWPYYYAELILGWLDD